MRELTENLKKYKGIIFDLDGVIVSTDNCHFEAWKKMADEEGIYFDRIINERLRGVSRMESLEIILEKAEKDYTEEEKRILTAAEKYKIEQMFDYILTNYGWEYAERFYNWDQWRKLFDKHGIVPNLKVPHCEYTDSRQCDLFCPFFKKKCMLEEKYYENNL